MATEPNVGTRLKRRGEGKELGAFVVAIAFSRSGRRCAFALGDGTVRGAALDAPGAWREIRVHGGVVLTLAAGIGADDFVSGGDDGLFCRIAPTGEVAAIARYRARWVEHVLSHPGAGGQGILAAAVGRSVYLFDASGRALRDLDHASTVSGIAIDRRGVEIGTSHYNGALLWPLGRGSAEPRRLEWKGSHTAIAIHPGGDAVVTAMQENALHGWRLSDGQHMRMSGYPRKTDSLAFSASGRWLATSGADAVILWPFFDGGPMGRTPTELAGTDGIACTRVACHPAREALAAGFADGTVVLADITSKRILPLAGPGRGSVSALAWSADGAYLALGTEEGFAALVDLAKR